MLRVVWAEESKTGLGYEIVPSQQKCQRKPSLQLMANSAVRQHRDITVFSTLQPQQGIHTRNGLLPSKYTKMSVENMHING